MRAFIAAVAAVAALSILSASPGDALPAAGRTAIQARGNAEKPVLYVSEDNGVLFGFDLPVTKKGIPLPSWVTNNGVSGAYGLAATATNLYVANQNLSQILVFTPPATAPTLAISDPGQAPSYVAVNAAGSEIWVDNACSVSCSGAGNLLEYSGAGVLQQTIRCGDLQRYYELAVDAAGDVVVDGQDQSYEAHVDVVPKGANSCTPLSNISLEIPGGITFTAKGDLVVGDERTGIVDVYAAPNFQTLVSTTTLPSAYAASPTQLVLDKDGKHIWSANASNSSVTEFTFPNAGSTPVVEINGFYGPIYGVTLMPPAHT